MKLAVSGPEEYALQLAALEEDAEATANSMVFAGAKIVADAIMARLKGLSTVSDQKNIALYRKKQKTRLSEGMKAGLIESFGISRFRNDGGVIYAKIGFDGYNAVRTKKYPSGQPNQLIARLLEGGSQYFDADPFIRPAVRASKEAAIQEMRIVLDERIRKKVNN